MPIPTPNIVLMLLIGVVFGGISAVILRGSRSVFIVNILLGIIGAVLGALLPVLMGSAPAVDVSTESYLVRSLMGSFLLVVLASLFRSAKPANNR